MEHGSMTQDKTQAEGVRHVLREDHRLLAPRQPLVRRTQVPQRIGGKDVANHAYVLPVEERLSTVLLGIIQGDTLREVSACSGWLSHVE